MKTIIMFLFLSAFAASAQIMEITLLPEDTTNNIPAYIQIRSTQPADMDARLEASNRVGFDGNIQLVTDWACPNPQEQPIRSFFPQAFYGPMAFFRLEFQPCTHAARFFEDPFNLNHP